MRTRLPPQEVIDANRKREFARYNFLPLKLFAKRIGLASKEARELIESGRIQNVMDISRAGGWPQYRIPPAEADKFLAEEQATAERRAVAAEARRLQELAQSGVYIVRAEGLARYKIGYSYNVESRVADLQTTCPVVLTLVAHIPGVLVAEERALHGRFAASRLHGEWFSETPDLLAFIEGHRP